MKSVACSWNLEVLSGFDVMKPDVYILLNRAVRPEEREAWGIERG